MKKILTILAGALIAASACFSVSAEIPAFKDKSWKAFDAKELTDVYSNIKTINKTTEKIDFTFFVYDDEIKGWKKFGTSKLKKYNDSDLLDKLLQFKLTSVSKFQYFAYTTSKTQLETKYEISTKDDLIYITASYVKAIRPLSGLSAGVQKRKDAAVSDDISVDFEFTNISGKDISAVSLTLLPQNVKGETMTCERTGRSEQTVKTVEPTKDGETYKSATGVLWTNASIKKIKVTKVKIFFVDGTETEYEL